MSTNPPLRAEGNRDRPNLRYGDLSIAATQGERLLDIILNAGVDHRHICGGRGFCTSCRIEVMEGQENLSPVSDLERERLGRDAGRLRLACQTRIAGNASVRVPSPVSTRFSPEGE